MVSNLAIATSTMRPLRWTPTLNPSCSIHAEPTQSKPLRYPSGRHRMDCRGALDRASCDHRVQGANWPLRGRREAHGRIAEQTRQGWRQLDAEVTTRAPAGL